MNWIDGHCHLADFRISGQLEAILERSRAANVTAWVQGGVSPEDWDRQLLLRSQIGPGLILSFGLHPWWVSHADLQMIESALERLNSEADKADAIGELGLDYSLKAFDESIKNKQKMAFERQLENLNQKGKPVILHIVQSHGDAVKILQKFAPFPNGGLLHSFSGSWEVALQYLEMGLILSVSGNVGRTGFKKLKDVVRRLDVKDLILETDSPGKRLETEPSHLIEVSKSIAQIRGVSFQEILDQSTVNLKRIFGQAASQR
jgi:TatD DNase family protein